MLADYCRDIGNRICKRLLPGLVRLGTPPWMMNLCSVASAVWAAYFFFYHSILPALLFLSLNAVFDYMDGGISRVLLSSGKTLSGYRTIFHILSDKLSEVVIFSGMIAGNIVCWEPGLLVIATCLILTLSGRWVQRMGLFDLENSFFDRADRVVALLLFCSLGLFQLALIIICIMNTAGLAQRIYAAVKARSPKQALH